MINGEYLLVVAPKQYKGKLYRDKYCYEHHLVWWYNTGEILKKDECLHHIDKNKHNNAINNLEKMCVQQHVSSHNLQKNKQPYVGIFCPICNNKKIILGSIYKSRLKNYGVNYKACCSRACQVTKQHKDKNNLAYSSIGS